MSTRMSSRSVSPYCAWSGGGRKFARSASPWLLWACSYASIRASRSRRSALASGVMSVVSLEHVTQTSKCLLQATLHGSLGAAELLGDLGDLVALQPQFD